MCKNVGWLDAAGPYVLKNNNSVVFREPKSNLIDLTEFITVSPQVPLVNGKAGLASYPPAAHPTLGRQIS